MWRQLVEGQEDEAAVEDTDTDMVMVMGSASSVQIPQMIVTTKINPNHVRNRGASVP